MSFRAAIEALQMADAFESLEFYATNLDKGTNMNKGPQLGCRIYESMFSNLSSDKMRELVRDLNAAIKPVTDAWRERMLTEARDRIGVTDNGPEPLSVDPERFM